jgi:cell division protein FtsI/penicillin-binding protein 2
MLVGAIFTARLFYLQIVRYDYFRLQAATAQKRSYEIPAERGRILAYDGQEKTPLVLNEVQPTVFVDQRYVKNVDATAEKLQQILGGNTEEIKKTLDGDSAYVVLKNRITREQATKIKDEELAGIGLNDRTYRVYPEATLGSQLLGFVNAEGKGQYGLEEAIDDDLSGEDGVLEAVTDINNVPLTTNEDNVIKPAQDGKEVVLTIDVNIQRYVEDALKKGVEASGGQEGSAVVIDPNTGAVKAMANYPTYNPEKIDEVKDYGVFSNKVVTEAYETGSGVKVFTMAAGVNEGKVTKDTTFYDSGEVQVEDRLIENSDGGLGTISMTRVIQNSINTGVVFVLNQLGGGSINEQARQTLHKYFVDKFGFGAATGIAQANEASGTIIGPNDPDGNNVRYANMTFGQGMTVTMLQMVSAVSSLINGGDYYQPYLVDGTVNENNEFNQNQPNKVRSDIISDQTSADVREMMLSVVNSGGGISAKREGYQIGGKTGTAQVIEDSGLYSEDREVGSFIGFGASSKNDYVIMTRVVEPTIGGYAGTAAAAPIFADISNFLIDYYQIPPNS